jgi:hypothetical protein
MPLPDPLPGGIDFAFMKTVACNLATCGKKATQEVAEKLPDGVDGNECRKDAALAATMAFACRFDDDWLSAAPWPLANGA